MNTLHLPILLVEDDENDAYFFERAVNKAAIPNPLRRLGDGQQAIQYLSGLGEYADRTLHPLPILVMLDLNLPVKHGLEVLRWMRTEDRTRNLIVIVLTSSMDVLDIHEAYSLGANSYLVKPSDPNELGSLVETIKAYWLTLNAPPPLRDEEERLRFLLPKSQPLDPP